MLCSVSSGVIELFSSHLDFSYVQCIGHIMDAEPRPGCLSLEFPSCSCEAPGDALPRWEIDFFASVEFCIFNLIKLECSRKSVKGLYVFCKVWPEVKENAWNLGIYLFLYKVDNSIFHFAIEVINTFLYLEFLAG